MFLFIFSPEEEILSRELFNLSYCVGFLVFLKSSFSSKWSDNPLGNVLLFFPLLRLALWLWGQFYRRIHEVLRGRYILWCLWEIFYRYVRSIWIIMSVSFIISLLSLCLEALLIGESGVVKYPTVHVWNSMCNLSFINVSLKMCLPLCLGLKCSVLRAHLGRFFLSWVWCVLLCLFWLILVQSLFS